MYLLFLRSVFSPRSVRVVGTLSSIAFAFLYAFAVGFVFRSQVPVHPAIPVPSVEIWPAGNAGPTPWLVIYLDRYWIARFSLDALLIWAGITTLFGLAVSGLFFLWRSGLGGGWTCSKSGGVLTTFASVLPSFLTIYSCCGGGLVTFALLSTGLLPLLSGFMLDYGWLLTALSVAALIFLQYRLYKTWLKSSSQKHLLSPAA